MLRKLSMVLLLPGLAISVSVSILLYTSLRYLLSDDCGTFAFFICMNGFFLAIRLSTEPYTKCPAYAALY